MKRTPPSGKATLPELRGDVFELHECLEVLAGKMASVEGSINKYDAVYDWGADQLSTLKKWRRGLYAVLATFALAVVGGAGASAWTVASGIIWPHVTKADVEHVSARTAATVAIVVKRAAP